MAKTEETPTDELVASVAIRVPLDDAALSLVPGEVVDADQIPSGTLTSMLRLGQLIPASEFTEGVEPPIGEDVDPSNDPPGPLAELELSKSIVGLLVGAGLDSREKVVEHAKANEGFGDLLGPQQAESVFAALKATETKD